MKIQPGMIVEADITAPDSFYRKVRGKVVSVDAEWVSIVATDVIDKWSLEWSEHPTSCQISARIENTKGM